MAKPPKVALVHDQRDPNSTEALAAQAGLVPMLLKAANGSALSQLNAVVYDIDLTNLSAVSEARAGLAEADLKAPLIFAVDEKAKFHLSRTQANALGASIILRRPLTAQKLREALRALGVIVPEPPAVGIEARAGGASIKAAAEVLDSTFAVLRSGGKLDVKQSIEASRELLDGVGKSGLTAWLESVRDYHEGTFQHCLLVTGAAVAYAKQANLPDKEQLALSVAALLHDIGKAEIPLEILDKPGKLTDAEFEIVKRHPIIGRDYLLTQKSLPPDVISAVTHHHEYLDGSGYPHGLQGYEIEPMTRILTVCDIYGALAERRAYKEPKSPQESILILVDMADRGKVEYDIVRTLGAAVGVNLPEGHFKIL